MTTREAEFQNALEHLIRDFMNMPGVGRARLLDILRQKAAEWATKKE